MITPPRCQGSWWHVLTAVFSGSLLLVYGAASSDDERAGEHVHGAAAAFTLRTTSTTHPPALQKLKTESDVNVLALRLGLLFYVVILMAVAAFWYHSGIGRTTCLSLLRFLGLDGVVDAQLAASPTRAATARSPSPHLIKRTNSAALVKNSQKKGIKDRLGLGGLLLQPGYAKRSGGRDRNKTREEMQAGRLV